MDEHEDDLNQTIKSPIKRYGSTRKIYLYNSKYWRSTIYFSLAISQFNKKNHTQREENVWKLFESWGIEQINLNRKVQKKNQLASFQFLN